MGAIEYLVIFVVAGLATLLFVPLAKRIAIRFKAIDYPSERRVNKTPIPRMGGLAMFLGLIVVAIVVALGVWLFGWDNPLIPHPRLTVNYIGVGIGVVLMFAVGVVDDVKNLRPLVKFLWQVIAACIVAASGLLLASIRNPFGAGYIEFGWVAYPITVFYLVAFANIINLIDGLDGLAAGITAISALTIFVFSLSTNRVDAAIMSIALVGICVGFLRWNFHPASIFMGDSGSLLLGFSLGIVSLFAVARSAVVISVLVPILAAGVPIVDTALAIIRRIRAHKPIVQADGGHIHHRLMEIGFSQRTTVLIMWAWTAVLAICGVMITRANGVVVVVAVCVAIAVTIFGIYRLRLFNQVLLHHYNPRRRKNANDAEGSDQTDQAKLDEAGPEEVGETQADFAQADSGQEKANTASADSGNTAPVDNGEPGRVDSDLQ